MDSTKTTRKSIKRTLLLTAAGVSSLFLWKNSSLIRNVFSKKKRKRLVMLMDLDKCIGCHACSVACKAENGVALGGFRTTVLEKETGEYPNVERFFLPMMCNHCEDAPCLSACPNNAIIKRKDGIVDIDKDKCMGFQLCVTACPYGAIYMNPDTNPDPMVEDYPSRIVGKADKCNFCSHRIDEGLEPACSNTCPTGARLFGDLEDEKSLVAQLIKKEKLSGLLEEEGTKPQVYYKGGKTKIFQIRKKINEHG